MPVDSPVLDRPQHGVRLLVSYDGTDFAGWQHQDGQRTVQGELEAGLDRMGVEHGPVRGASRTDAGVHALGQVCAFDTPQAIDPYGWMRGLNTALPDDVAVVRAEPVPHGYNPRFDTLEKTYRYLIQTGTYRQPCWRRQAWYVGPAFARPWRGPRSNAIDDWLDLTVMREAAQAFEGEHDFRSFRKKSDPRATSVRRIDSIEIVPQWREHEGLLAIEVRGRAFMQHMVRILVGTLVEIGRGYVDLARIPQLLSPDADREDTGPTAPAHGLCLVAIELGRLEREAAAT